MTRSLEAEAAYITGDVISMIIRRLEEVHGLTLSIESITRIHRQVRLVIEPNVQHALAQEMVTHQ